MKILPLLLDFKRSTISTEVHISKEFLYDVINLAEKEKAKLDSSLKEIIAENPEDLQDIYEDFATEYGIYDSKYIELANNSMLITSYSFFENQLKEIAKMLNKSLIVKAGIYTNSQGSYAEKLKNEIYTITGLDFSSLNSVYAKIDEYRLVRNIIVHNGANLLEVIGTPLISQQNYSLINSKPEITINADSGDFYITNKKFVFDFLDLIENYLTELIKKFDQLNKNNMK